MNPDNPNTLPFEKRFAQYDDYHCPGLAVMVIQDGVTKFKKGYGHSNLVSKEKVDCQTNFRMASVSKQFTAMCVAILEERGKISADHYISQYLPAVPDYMSNIKVSHLVHHLSGLPDYADALESSDKSKPLISNLDVLDYYRNQDKLDFEAGTKHEYSNGGYCLLALVVERAANQPFKEFSEENIFVPAGMANTAIIECPSNIKNQASSYSVWHFFEDIDFNTGNALQGVDGVYTSLNDMEAWIHAIDNCTLVNTTTTQRIFSGVQTTHGDAVQYGYGWRFDKFRTIDLILHTGSWVGFNTIVAKAPKKNIWLVGFSNTRAISSQNAVGEIAKFYLDRDT